mgnify:CR=1 FL=1|tara:strand:- start:1537 stop:2559 length:1023 start_codon:yes stop_codon:yes gene_type:complete
MELWLDCRESKQLIDDYNFDKFLSNETIAGKETIICHNNSILINQEIVGSIIQITDNSSQNDARKMVGLVKWIILEFENWSMIPIENLIAASQGTPTKIAAKIRNVSEAQGAGFALESGVDAIIVENDKSIIEAALITKFQRTENKTDFEQTQIEENDCLEIAPHRIISIEDGGVGDRYCIDLTTLLSQGEGLLIGSSASSLAIVHGETLESEYVPPRPFRVNAGPPHSYVLMADRKTKYLSELKSNDSVLVCDTLGNTRIAQIGRLKIEKRPFLHIFWHNIFDKPSSMFLQQAETVRLVDYDGNLISITSLKTGDKILGWNDIGSRHIGEKVNSKVSER